MRHLSFRKCVRLFEIDDAIGVEVKVIFRAAEFVLRYFLKFIFWFSSYFWILIFTEG